jgi:hypothetical protein
MILEYEQHGIWLEVRHSLLNGSCTWVQVCDRFLVRVVASKEAPSKLLQRTPSVCVWPEEYP